MRGKPFNLLAAFLLAAALGGCSSSLDSEGAQDVVDTAEDILRATTFVGADRCGVCHSGMHAGWQQTAHTMKLRDGALEVNYVNDGDLDGRADFFGAAEFDLCTEAAANGNFDDYCANGLVLGSNFGGPYVKIGATVYYITYTLGGSGWDTTTDGLVLNAEAQWKQRYITSIGQSNYILPIQFNAQTQEYVTYGPTHWYDEDTDLPLAEVNKKDSYERRCAGCHVTGLEVSVNDDGEWLMDFSDISVSCEACHGPGGQHATSPTKGNIINPATMEADEDLNGDDVVDGLDDMIVRNYVCFQCHSRGEGKFADDDDNKTGYPSRVDGDGNAIMYMPGLDWSEYYDVTTDASQYWGGAPDSGDFIASKSHHQQQQDFASGPHAPDKSYDHECFSCHDMHDNTNKHMVVSKIAESGIQVTTENDNSTLCLACHAGHGDFEDLTAADINLNDVGTIGPVVQDHMGRAAMGNAIYNPTVTGVGRCSTCHMPKTAKSAVAYDIHSHTFKIIWPSLTTANPGLPNACEGCHDGTNGYAGTDQILDWALSGHGDATGDPWLHYDWDGMDTVPAATNRQSCQRCHTATGSHNFLTDPDNYDAADNDFGFLSVGENQVLYCYGCHDGNGTDIIDPGSIPFPSGVSLSLPDGSNVCMSCHQGRESGATVDEAIAEGVDSSGTFSFTNIHYFAAAASYFGSEAAGGYEYASKTYRGRNPFTAHGFVATTKTTCVGCHLRNNEDHNFKPEVNDCSGCHTGTSFSTLSGSPGTNYTKIETLKGELQAVLVASGVVFESGYPYFRNLTTAAQLKGAYNWQVADKEPCGYIHNGIYIQQLLFDSIEDMGGTPSVARP